MKVFIDDMFSRIREDIELKIQLSILCLSLSLSIWQHCVLWQDCAPIRKMHTRTLAPLFLSSLASLYAALKSLTSLVAEPMDGVRQIPISLSLSRPKSTLCGIRIGTIWGDRLLWRAYCSPAAGIVSGIQWSGPVSATHPRPLLLVSRIVPPAHPYLTSIRISQACVSCQVLRSRRS